MMLFSLESDKNLGSGLEFKPACWRARSKTCTGAFRLVTCWERWPVQNESPLASTMLGKIPQPMIARATWSPLVQAWSLKRVVFSRVEMTRSAYFRFRQRWAGPCRVQTIISDRKGFFSFLIEKVAGCTTTLKSELPNLGHAGLSGGGKCQKGHVVLATSGLRWSCHILLHLFQTRDDGRRQ